ncbi:hypothetical protein GCM10023116_29030 [Kistimonas scapharcae]|uniref:Uncharacterized protein n=1 Tax=Kistimonas scapharcae TaxID=1036133 RepID=A0ABP8V5R0_9GAMM
MQPIVDGFKEINKLFLCVREGLVRKEDDDKERLRKAPLIIKPLHELLSQIDGMLNFLEAFFQLNQRVVVSHMGRKEEYLGCICDKLGYLKPYRSFPDWWEEQHAPILQEVQLPQIEGATGESLEIEEIQDEQEGYE